MDWTGEVGPVPGHLPPASDISLMFESIYLRFLLLTSKRQTKRRTHNALRLRWTTRDSRCHVFLVASVLFYFTFPSVLAVLRPALLTDAAIPSPF